MIYTLEEVCFKQSDNTLAIKCFPVPSTLHVYASEFNLNFKAEIQADISTCKGTCEHVRRIVNTQEDIPTGKATRRHASMQGDMRADKDECYHAH